MEFFYDEILSGELLKEYRKSYLNQKIYSFIKNEIINNIHNYIINTLNKIFNKLFDILKYYKKIKNYDTDIIVIFEIAHDIRNIMEKIDITLTSIETAKMDFYALCRIFRYFEIKKSNNHPRFIKNICVYAGSYHTELYSKFIETLDNNFRLITNIPEDENKSCITIDDIINIPLSELL